MTSAELLPAAVLKRKAVVYIRQSTQAQVQTNLESQRRQYELVDVARQRGFHDIEVIGTDERFTLTYSMTIAFGFGPSFTTDMATSCRAADGKVVFCRDYFDPLGSLVQPLGPVRWFYRKLFGLLVA